MLAKRYSNKSAVIGADLDNEPHGTATWGDGNPATDWRLAAERAGNAILHVNRHWLIFVEGIERVGPSDWYWWGGNLAAAGGAPVRLLVPHRLVYEPHDYGPEIYPQKWFSDPTFPANLPGVWDSHWGYLQKDSIAPVLLGEFGGRQVDGGAEGQWIHALVNYLHANGISYTFWSFNPDSVDTGGLLEDDWKTVDPAKLALLRSDQAPLFGSNGRHKRLQSVREQHVDSTLSRSTVSSP
jgi:endoglucanase